MRVFISQPMRGLTDREIAVRRGEIVEQLNREYRGVEILDSFFDEECPPDKNAGVWYLGKSLEVMSSADLVYFAKDWELNRGCRFEENVARVYGITRKYEEN